VSDGTTYDLSNVVTYASEATGVVNTGTANSGRQAQGQSVGTTSVIPSFHGIVATALAFTVTNDQTPIVELLHRTGWSSGTTLLGIQGTQRMLTVEARFGDGTRFENIINNQIGIAVDTLVTLQSNDVDAITVSNQLVATLRGNAYKAVTLTVRAYCVDDSISQTAVATQAVNPNLEPLLGDVDLGSRNGLPFPAKNEGETLSVEVRVNSQGANLIAFQANIRWNDAHLESTVCTQGVDWTLEWYCALKNPANLAKISAISLESVASGGALRIAALTLRVLTSNPVISSISGTILVMTRRRSGVDDIEDRASAVYAGESSVALNGASRRRHRVSRSLLSSAVEFDAHHIKYQEFLGFGFDNETDVELLGKPVENKRRRLLQAGCVAPPVDVIQGSIGTDCIPRVLGDVNGDCRFDLSDALVLEKHIKGESESGIDYKDLSLFSEWQRIQMDLTLDYLNPTYDKFIGGCKLWATYPANNDLVCPSFQDATYMKRATANHRFLVVSALREIVEPQLNSKFASLTVSATVYNPVTDPFNLNEVDPSGCAAGMLPSTSSVVIQKLKNTYLDDEEYVGFEPAQGAATPGAGYTKVKIELGSTTGSFNNSDMTIVQGTFLSNSSPIAGNGGGIVLQAMQTSPGEYIVLSPS